MTFPLVRQAGTAGSSAGAASTMNHYAGAGSQALAIMRRIDALHLDYSIRG